MTNIRCARACRATVRRRGLWKGHRTRISFESEGVTVSDARFHADMASDSQGRKLVVRLQYADCFQVSSAQLDSVLTEIRKVRAYFVDRHLTAVKIL